MTYEHAVALMADVLEIAKYLQWNSGVGREKAQEIINAIHDGKYGDSQGCWVQADEALRVLRASFPRKESMSNELEPELHCLLCDKHVGYGRPTRPNEVWCFGCLQAYGKLETNQRHLFGLLLKRVKGLESRLSDLGGEPKS